MSPAVLPVFLKNWAGVTVYLLLWVLWLAWHLSRVLHSSPTALLAVIVLGTLGALPVGALIAGIWTTDRLQRLPCDVTPLCRFCWYNLTGCQRICPECGAGYRDAAIHRPIREPSVLGYVVLFLLVTFCVTQLAVAAISSQPITPMSLPTWGDQLATHAHWTAVVLLIATPLLWLGCRLWLTDQMLKALSGVR